MAQAGELGDEAAVEQILLEIGWKPDFAKLVAAAWTTATDKLTPAVKSAQTKFITAMSSPALPNASCATGRPMLPWFGVVAPSANAARIGAACPTILDHVTPDMAIAREEVFGPVLVIIRAHDVDEALAVENASPYGNAASVFTESGGVARRVMERANAGMVGVNVGVPVPREPFSFGGWNDSRFGVGDITGRGSIEFWTQSKKMTTKWNREAGTNWMS